MIFINDAAHVNVCNKTETRKIEIRHNIERESKHHTHPQSDDLEIIFRMTMNSEMCCGDNRFATEDGAEIR